MIGKLVFGLCVGVLLVLASTVLGAYGSVTASGSVTAPAWGHANSTSVGPNYTVTFDEVGLPSGTNWTVAVCITWWCNEDFGAHVNSSNTSSMTFQLPNGSYHFQVFPVDWNWSNPSHGSFTVNGSSPPAVLLNFAKPPRYTVTFSETGLAPGTEWAVLVRPANASSGCPGWSWGWCNSPSGRGSAPGSADRSAWGHEFNSSNASTLTFRLTNGTYNFTVLDVPGYAIVGAANGTVNVSGAAPPTVAVTYTVLPTYTVTFTETGLPNGTNWTVTVTGSGQVGGHWGGRGSAHQHHVRYRSSSSTSTITFALTNGSYRFRAGWAIGYFSNDSYGRFNVSGGSPPPIAISFQAVPTYNVSFNESGLPNGTDWGLTVDGYGGHYDGAPLAHIEISHAAQGVVSFQLPAGHFQVKLLKLVGWRVASDSAGSRIVVGSGPVEYRVAFAPTHTHGPHHHGGAMPSGGVGAEASPLVLAVARDFGAGTFARIGL